MLVQNDPEASKNAMSFSAWPKSISALNSKEKFTLQWVLKTSSHWDISSQSDSSVFSSSEFSDDLHISSFQPKVAIRIDSTFYVDNANKHGRNFHKDSPCRWFSIIWPLIRELEEIMTIWVKQWIQTPPKIALRH